MHSALSYNESFKVIKEACYAKLVFIDAVIKQCREFAYSNIDFLDRTSKIQLDFPTKRPKGLAGLLNNIKGPGEFPGGEITFEENIKEMCKINFQNPPALGKKVQYFLLNFINKVVAAKTQFSTELDNLIQLGEQSSQMLIKANNDFNAAYKKYRDLAKELEILHPKKDDLKFAQKFNATYDIFVKQEREVIELHKTRNEQETNWATNMENLLTQFEKLDRRLNIEISDAYINFSPYCEYLKDEIEEVINKLSEISDPDIELDELDQYLEFSDTPSGEPINAELFIPNLTFDPAQILGNQTFDGADSGRVAVLNRDIHSTSPEVRDLKKDQVVLAKVEPSGVVFAQCGDFVGAIPHDSYKSLVSSFVPHTGKITKDYPGPPAVKAGDSVYIHYMYGPTAYITTHDYMFMEIPSDHVV